MTSPFGEPDSSVPGGIRDPRTGLDITDPALADSVRRGLESVEELLHRTLSSDFEFAAETSLHLVDAGGKRFRPLFTLLAAQFGDPLHEKVIKAAAVIELVHLATLYHDDVMDEATVRRGATSANARWDNSVAILTGDLLFAQASGMVADLGADAVRFMAKTFEALVTGQMRETVGAGESEDPVAHYLTVIYEKTGSLIATAGRFGAQFSGAEQKHIDVMERLGKIIGTAFQISDDIIDIASAESESGKTPGTDLREGVRTLPMLYAIAAEDTDPRLRELLAGPITDDAGVVEALELLRMSSGLVRARETLDTFAAEARAEVEALPVSPARDAFEGLVDYVVARTR